MYLVKDIYFITICISVINHEEYISCQEIYRNVA